ncbi:hypothetical protein SADUNF_Sadunf05G0114000 [Salix dunnii]|uniref:Uncharacterized protein n=1 Tax=Salix dunnii TaxID=1413687 RepID=A0A835K1K4_9ROSI|nr:hypothetical protein SADUNF_Sadunf05G0114000 [Salix dunnii]
MHAAYEGADIDSFYKVGFFILNSKKKIMELTRFKWRDLCRKSVMRNMSSTSIVVLKEVKLEQYIVSDQVPQALWVAVKKTRQQVAQIREMLAIGANLIANNRPQLTGLAPKELPEANLLTEDHDSEEDLDERDDMGTVYPHQRDA